jgi:hypothetical protein
MRRFRGHLVAVVATGLVAGALAVIPGTAAQAADLGNCKGVKSGITWTVTCTSPYGRYFNYQAIAHCRQNSGTLFSVLGNVTSAPYGPVSVAKCTIGTLESGSWSTW